MGSMPSAALQRFRSDLDGARRAVAAGDVDHAWALLEEAHVLSQPWAWPHVRVHLSMLVLGARTRDSREVLGQVVRSVVAGPGSLLGRYPVGNTGRARVPATRPMPLPPELAELLDGAGGGR